MIVSQANKAEFLRHALVDDIDVVIARQFRIALGHGVAYGEFRAWKHSLLEMARVLSDSEISEDAGIAIEYQLPASSKRIDFMAGSTRVKAELLRYPPG